MTPTQKAREAFNEYAAMDSPDLPENPVQALQVELFRWESREFGGGNITNSVLGANEEVGELAESIIMALASKVATANMARAILKRGQGIRGFDDMEKFKETMGDAIADNVIFSIQACTKSRLDFWTLLCEVASDVMDNRKWSQNKLDGAVTPTISSEEELQVALKRIGEIFDAKPGTPECDELDALCAVVKPYEDEHYPIAPPDNDRSLDVSVSEEVTGPRDECEKAQNLIKGARCGQCAPCRRNWARKERTNG